MAKRQEEPMSDKKPVRVIVLTLEGGKRCATYGDIFIEESGSLGRAYCNHEAPRFCYAQHPIDVPDDSHTLTVQTRGSGQTPPAIHIPLPPVSDPLVEKIKEYLVREISLTTLTYDSLAREIAALVREGGVSHVAMVS
jgi:hypothetical protein